MQFGSWGEINVGQKLLLIAGIVTMVFGIGFFLKYSFDQGWIGPAGRVALAYLWGAAFLALGNTLDKRGYNTYGRCLVGGSIAVLYFATYAGFQIYHLFPQTAAFFLMLITTAFAALLALKYNTQWLAILTTIGGFFTPILLSTGVDNQNILMTYMLILNVGVLVMASVKNWRSLFVLAFVFTYLLYLGWYSEFYSAEKFWPSIIFLNLFFIIYAVIPYLHLYRTNSETDIDEISTYNTVLILFFNSLITGIFSFIMIKGRYSYEWMSVLTISYAALFTMLAAITMARRPKLKWPAAFLIAKAMLFIILTVPCLFSKHIITVLWAAQAAVLCWLGSRTMKKQFLVWAYIVLLLAIVKFFFYDYFQVFHLSLFSLYFTESYAYLLPERLFTALFIPVILFWFSRRAKTRALEIFNGNSLPDSAILMVFFWITLFITLNIETAAFFHEYLPGARFAAISVLWSVFATILMLLGFRYRSSGLRNCSLLLFLITIIKVFFVDIAKLSTPYRIVSFIILGLVLIGVSYLYHKYKKELEDALAANKTEKKSV
ncbi:MAG: DUF2339 domain-containing protein [Deltaproteobacteria bacterium]|nr:DUF2339 domain-containing protein [Deltaproteobacteria bacterium]